MPTQSPSLQFTHEYNFKVAKYHHKKKNVYIYIIIIILNIINDGSRTCVHTARTQYNIRRAFLLRYCTAVGRWYARLSTAVPCARFHTIATARGPTADFVIFAMSLFTNHHNDTDRDKMAHCLTREMPRGNRRRSVVVVVVVVGRSTGLS